MRSNIKERLRVSNTAALTFQPVTFRRKRLAGFRIACAVSIVLTTPSQLHSEDITPVCQSGANVISMSHSLPSPSAAEVHVEEVPDKPGNVTGTVHLYLKNDGPTRLHQICAHSFLVDNRDVSQNAQIALSRKGQVKVPPTENNNSCLVFEQPWQVADDVPLDLDIQVGSSSIPLTGFISLTSSLSGSDKAGADAATTKNITPGQANQKTPPIDKPCISYSKPLTRPIMLLPSRQTGWFLLPLLAALICGGGYFLTSFFLLKDSSSQKNVGAPEWNFSTSFATNFTVGAGLLTPLLGAVVVTETLHYMTKFHYSILSILFASLLLLAPAIFTFFSTPQQKIDTSGEVSRESVGSVRLFNATAAMMIAGVVGQLCVGALATAEVNFRGYISQITMVSIIFLLAVAALGTVVYATRTASSYGTKPTDNTISNPKLELLIRKAELMTHSDVASSESAAVFNSADHDMLKRLVAQHNARPHKWNMF